MKPAVNGSSPLFMWMSRGAWVALGLVAPWMSLADQRGTGIAAVLTWWGWALWGLVLIALCVPSAASLTLVRAVSPLAAVAGFWFGSTSAILTGALAVIVLWSPDLGDGMVQAGAYGEETRFLLRTPVAHLLPAAAVWVALAAGLVVGPLCIGAGNLLVGGPLTTVGLALGPIVPRRLHRLSRRWLVLVPAGVVLHDHMVLAETVMVRTNNLESVAIADTNGEAADLTGGVLGKRLVVTLREPDKIVLTPIAARVNRTTAALHVKQFTVRPVRLLPALATVTAR